MRALLLSRPTGCCAPGSRSYPGSDALPYSSSQPYLFLGVVRRGDRAALASTHSMSTPYSRLRHRCSVRYLPGSNCQECARSIPPKINPLPPLYFLLNISKRTGYARLSRQIFESVGLRGKYFKTDKLRRLHKLLRLQKSLRFRRFRRKGPKPPLKNKTPRTHDLTLSTYSHPIVRKRGR